MPIKLNVVVGDFVAAIRSFESPKGRGDIVYGWDNDSSTLVIGAHRGYDDEYDSETGVRIKHRHKILVMSWQDQMVMSFDNAITVPMDFRARVITPEGTGVLGAVDDDSIKVRLDIGLPVIFNNLDLVQLFNWDRINAAKTSND